jgi:hypothetical protein
MQALSLKERRKRYNLDEIESFIEKYNIPPEDVRSYFAANSKVLAQMAVETANSIERLSFDYRYNKEYKITHPFLMNYANELAWQARPFFDDTLRIMELISGMASKVDRTKEKNLKVAIMSHRSNIPYLYQNIVEAKYETVPKFRTSLSEESEAKNKILEELNAKTDSPTK